MMFMMRIIILLNYFYLSRRVFWWRHCVMDIFAREYLWVFDWLSFLLEPSWIGIGMTSASMSFLREAPSRVLGCVWIIVSSLDERYGRTCCCWIHWFNFTLTFISSFGLNSWAISICRAMMSHNVRNSNFLLCFFMLRLIWSIFVIFSFDIS